VILTAASVSASELKWCGPLAWWNDVVPWWGEQRRSVHGATVWWSNSERLRVQRCSSPVGWARVPWQEAWWLFASRVTQSPQLEEATADNTTDVLLRRQPIVEADAKISYSCDRLDDVITNWKCQVSRWQLAQISSTAEPLQLSFNFRDLIRSVELFVVIEQVMADKIACENTRRPRCRRWILETLGRNIEESRKTTCNW